MSCPVVPCARLQGGRLTVDFTEKTRIERIGAEIRRILDTKALRQASNLELLR